MARITDKTKALAVIGAIGRRPPRREDHDGHLSQNCRCPELVIPYYHDKNLLEVCTKRQLCEKLHNFETHYQLCANGMVSEFWEPTHW